MQIAFTSLSLTFCPLQVPAAHPSVANFLFLSFLLISTVLLCLHLEVSHHGCDGKKKEKQKNIHVLAAVLFLGHPNCLFLHHLIPSFSVCLSPGEVSQQDNGKTFSVSSNIRIPVERKDNGAALSCEAFHPALGAQKRIRHYRLDVHCKFLPQAKSICGSAFYV